VRSFDGTEPAGGQEFGGDSGRGFPAPGRAGHWRGLRGRYPTWPSIPGRCPSGGFPPGLVSGAPAPL